LRGGPFADKRIIQLINRRVVPFFFNIGLGHGYDKDAKELIVSVDKRFAGNAVPTPPIWVFSPDSKLIGTIGNYVQKDKFFKQLRAILDKNSAYDKFSEDENRIIGLAEKTPDDSSAQIKAGRIFEELGKYEKASAFYAKAVEVCQEASSTAMAKLGLARIRRYEKDWVKFNSIVKNLNDSHQAQASADIAMETAYDFLHQKDYQRAKHVLDIAIHQNSQSKRIGEMHYWAGVACFRLNQKNWANFHWCWVIKNIPDDYNYMRCYIAALNDKMIYPNSDLGTRPRGGTMFGFGRDKLIDPAMKEYEKLKDQYHPIASQDSETAETTNETGEDF